MINILMELLYNILLFKWLKNKRETGKFRLMSRPRSILRTRYLIFIILVFFSSGAYGSDFLEIPSFFRPLISPLLQDGFDFEFLLELFADFRAEPVPSLMAIPLFPNETPEKYTQFLSPEAILLSKKFLRQNFKILRQMEDQFHVEKEVAVAILLVESRFGENIGKYRVIPTLASLSLIDSQENLLINYFNLWRIDPGLSYEWMEELAKRKSNWAYHELKCFLRIVRHEKIDPFEIYGSSAGALGMAQFTPSSYLAYGHNKRGFKTWLLSKNAAIFSIGNYLRSHGWKKNLSVRKKKLILWYYNHSEPYVETVLKVAQRIKKEKG
jgi:membrane-bound lytic murein transglycosylase B